MEPMAFAVQVGADEGFELAKAHLIADGFKLYKEIWSDQPPLYSHILAWIISNTLQPVFWCRFATLTCSIVLCVALFLLVRAREGPSVALLAVVFLIGSPAFLEISISCMQEIPALAFALAALAALNSAVRRFSFPKYGAACVFLVIALAIKLIVAYLFPVAFAIIAEGCRSQSRAIRYALKQMVLFLVPTLILTVLLQLILADSIKDLKDAMITALSAHFSVVKQGFSSSPISELPEDFPFEWAILFRNWDLTLPVLILLVRLSLSKARALLIGADFLWLALVVVMFSLHRPWWSYYYVHLAIPFSLITAKSFCLLSRQLWEKRRGRGVLLCYSIITAAWICMRVSLQIQSVRHLESQNVSLIISEVRDYKGKVKWIFCDSPIYSFHSGIPIPPKLAVLSLKRFWSGSLRAGDLRFELLAISPDLILLTSSRFDSEIGDLLLSDYVLKFRDERARLYLRRDGRELHKASTEPRTRSASINAAIRFSLPEDGVVALHDRYAGQCSVNRIFFSSVYQNQ